MQPLLLERGRAWLGLRSCCATVTTAYQTSLFNLPYRGEVLRSITCFITELGLSISKLGWVRFHHFSTTANSILAFPNSILTFSNFS